MQTCCPAVELRQYTLHPGMRDTLIDLFDREFVETQEATGMVVIGQFRDLNNPDRFVWLRGFQDMESRAAQLQQFYGGPVWKHHRDAANATMIDSDNVLLLRPVAPEAGFALSGIARPKIGATEPAPTLIVATIYHLKCSGNDFAEFFATNIVPALSQAGVAIVASFVTEHHPNTFPTLPVRERANVFVWFARFADDGAFKSQYPARELRTKIGDRIDGKPELLLLCPTARSVVR